VGDLGRDGSRRGEAAFERVRHCEPATLRADCPLTIAQVRLLATSNVFGSRAPVPCARPLTQVAQTSILCVACGSLALLLSREGQIPVRFPDLATADHGARNVPSSPPRHSCSHTPAIGYPSRSQRALHWAKLGRFGRWRSSLLLMSPRSPAGSIPWCALTSPYPPARLVLTRAFRPLAYHIPRCRRRSHSVVAFCIH
jgi:hypothetical protein